MERNPRFGGTWAGGQSQLWAKVPVLVQPPKGYWAVVGGVLGGWEASRPAHQSAWDSVCKLKV